MIKPLLQKIYRSGFQQIAMNYESLAKQDDQSHGGTFVVCSLQTCHESNERNEHHPDIHTEFATKSHDDIPPLSDLAPIPTNSDVFRRSSQWINASFKKGKSVIALCET